MNYNKVPDIITGKDLDYLSDMFNWNYGAFKNNYNSYDSITDEEIKDLIDEACELFDENMNLVLDIMGGTDE